MSPYTLPEEELVVVSGPEPGGVGGAYRGFFSTLKGFATTFMRLFEKPVTIEYPEEKTPVYPRFRGRHKLHRFDDTGLEKCVGCSLCAAACPAECIRVVAAENTADNMEANASNAADNLEANAQNAADAVRNAGEEKADAVRNSADADGNSADNK